jgi:hypothetical protein
MCLEGKIDINYGSGLSESMVAGETVLIPAVIKNLNLVPHGTAKALEVYVR